MDECRVPLLSDRDIPPPLIEAMRARLGDRDMPNLYRALANAPSMLGAWLDFAWRLRGEATSSRATRELIILRVAQLLDAPYEWSHHVVMARQAGVSERQIAELAEWSTSDAYDPVERAAIEMAEQQTNLGAASGQVISDLRRLTNEQATIELVLTASFYNCVARLLNSLAIPQEKV